jgi:hypothetical protein
MRPMRPNCWVENFRLTLSQSVRYLRSGVSSGVLTVELEALEAATALEGHFNSGRPLFLDGFSLSGAATSAGTEVFVTLAEAVPDRPLSEPSVSPVTGQPCDLSIFSIYRASVDLVTDLRIGASSGVETRLLDLQGRWLQPAPPLGANDHYQAVLLRDGGIWQSGTFKTVPAVRSRFGLESYFGDPLIGLFTATDYSDPGTQSSPSESVENLTQPNPATQFNYQNFL